MWAGPLSLRLIGPICSPVSPWLAGPRHATRPTRKLQPIHNSHQPTTVFSLLCVPASSSPSCHRPPVRQNGSVGRARGRRAREAGRQEPPARHAPHRPGAAARPAGDLPRPRPVGPRRRRDPPRPRNPPPMARRRSVLGISPLCLAAAMRVKNLVLLLP